MCLCMLCLWRKKKEWCLEAPFRSFMEMLHVHKADLCPRGLQMSFRNCACLCTCQDDWLLRASTPSSRPGARPCGVHCSCLAASLWCFPRVYGSFTFEATVNVHGSAAPAASWHAESLCLNGVLHSFKYLVLDLNIATDSLKSWQTGELSQADQLFLVVACPSSFMDTMFSRSAGSQQRFAEMYFRFHLYFHYSAFA